MPASTRARSALEWRIEVALLTEPLYLAGYAKAIVLSVLIMGSVLTFLALVTDNMDSIGAFWMLTGLAMAILMVAGVLGTALLTGNRLALSYTADGRGVVQTVVDRKLRAVSGVAAAAGVLTGNAGAAGAGMLARAQNRRSVAWSAVASARFHPKRRAVSLRNTWRTLLVVFCTDETYERFAALVKQKTAQHPGKAPPRRNPLPGLLVRTVLAVLCCLPFFGLPWPFELDLFVPLLTVCFALASVWLVSHLVLVAMGGLAFMWVDIAGRALLERQSTLDGSLYRFLDMMGAEDWLPLAVSAGGTIVLVLMGIGLISGRFATALSDDGEDADLDDTEDGDGQSG